VVTVRASVNTVGRTSMEIGVRVTAEPVTGGNSRHTNSCYVTMVALDPEGRPCSVPKLEIRTEDEYRRHRDAEERRGARLELAKRRRVRRENKAGG
jgi:acyl-CoA hydrolase